MYATPTIPVIPSLATSGDYSSERDCLNKWYLLKYPDISIFTYSLIFTYTVFIYFTLSATPPLLSPSKYSSTYLTIQPKPALP